jgi:c-di-GMP-binding flagellar brake protein YcgR
MSGTGAERRQHPRKPARFPLYVALGGELYHKTVSVQARDLSNGGLAFETSTALPDGARATVMLGRLDGLPRTAHIEARIVHCQPLPDGESFKVGVKFEDLVDITAEQLLAHVTQE